MLLTPMGLKDRGLFEDFVGKGVLFKITTPVQKAVIAMKALMKVST